MSFKKDDLVLATVKVLRKNPDDGSPETLNLVNEDGVIKRAKVYKDAPIKNTYWVKTQFGVHVLNEAKLVAKPAE